MLSKQYEAMLGNKNIIRVLSEFAVERGKEIGYENVFDYTLGNPSVPVPKSFNDSIIRLIGEKDSMSLHGYSQSLGIFEVRERVAQSLKSRFGIAYGPEHIFMTSGAAAAIAHAVRLVTVPGDEIITFAPYFPEYNPYVNLAGAVLRIVPADTESFQIDFDSFISMINEKTMAVLINSPNNPSGVVYSTGTLQRLGDLLREKSKEYGHDIYMISDEPYREIVYGGKTAPYAAKFHENTITCYSFSKSLSIPGERIGYIAINPACRDSEKMVVMCGQISRGIGHNCPSSIIQWAVSENLEVTGDISVYEENMNLLYDKLTSLNLKVVKPEGTFYIFFKSPETSMDFVEKGKKYDFLAVPADSFGCPGYIRLSYCIDTEKVKRSLPALEEFIKKEYNI